MLTHRLECVVFGRDDDGGGAAPSNTRALVLPCQVAGSERSEPSRPKAQVLGNKREGRAILVVEGRCPPPTSLAEALLRQGFTVLAASNLLCARQVLMGSEVRVDAVLFDRDLPSGAVEELLSEMEELPRQIGVVILADSADGLCAEALELRAVIVPVATPVEVLGNILKVAAEGYAGATIKRFSRRYKLSDKETEILRRVTKGASPKSIAAEMRCSLQAVYARLTRVCARTSCDSYQEVIAKLFQFSCHGLGHGDGK